jgi:hypothetical protein
MNQADVKELFDYRDGDLYWKVRPARNVDISKPAGSVNSWGYRQIQFKGKQYYAHRLVWLYVHGKFPNEQIDHINGDKLDNNIENLRDVSCQENKRNVSKYSNNRSGHTGVIWATHADKWVASIRVDGKLKHLGLFNILEDAVEARLQANIEHGYHDNHGREKEIEK